MQKLLFALAIGTVILSPAVASDREDAISIVHRWIKGFNNADLKMIVSACATETSMIDDFPHHEWHGVGACAKWFGDFQTMAKSAGLSRSAIAIGDSSHVEMSPSFAYVVAPVTLSFEPAHEKKGLS